MKITVTTKTFHGLQVNGIYWSTLVHASAVFSYTVGKYITNLLLYTPIPPLLLLFPPLPLSPLPSLPSSSSFPCQLKSLYPTRPVVLIGWSLGARIACKVGHVAKAFDPVCVGGD